MRAVFAVWMMWAATAAHAANSGPEVSVSGGKIRGILASYGGAVFKGIPFAQPPAGDLRWREPMPVKTWTGIREAATFAGACTQGGASGPPAARIACT